MSVVVMTSSKLHRNPFIIRVKLKNADVDAGHQDTAWDIVKTE